MSGICGYFHRKGTPIVSDALDPIMSKMQSYGKDGCHIWQQNSIAFGHLMTYVTPQSIGEIIPYEDSQSKAVVTADARLDNRDELCHLLDIPKPDADGIHDSQLILKAYLRWGTDCPKHLMGDFAFAIYDSRERHIFCSRDIMGVKPIYYYINPECFCFSSDIAALLHSPDVPVELNLRYVRSYLELPFFYHKEFTFYENIFKLPPAHFLLVKPDKLIKRTYWKPGQTAKIQYKQEEDYIQHLQELLDKAVTCRLRSAYPVGSHLSSGLDSSLLAVLAARKLKEHGEPLHTFSWASPPSPEDYPLKDERSIVEMISQKEGTTQHYTDISEQVLTAYLMRDITIQPTETLIHEIVVSQVSAKNKLRVMLSGWGGDEIIAFNGRGYFADLFYRGHWRTMTRELYWRARLHKSNFWVGVRNKVILPLTPDILLKLLRPNSSQLQHHLPMPICLQPDFRVELSKVKLLNFPNLRERAGVHRNQTTLLSSGHLTNRMESWAYNGAEYGIEYRYPLLDQRIIEFGLSIPDYLYFKNGWKRYLYRRSAQKYLPSEAVWKRTKSDTALSTPTEEMNIHVYKDILSIIDKQRTLIVANKLIDPDALIRGISNYISRDIRKPNEQEDFSRGLWLAFLENSSYSMHHT